MSDLDKVRVERESRRHGTGLGPPSRYSAAVERYLGAVGYGFDEASPAPVEMPTAAVAPGGTVLVGADDSLSGYTAVDHAAIEAELRGWDLRIVHAQRPGGLRPESRDVGARLLERLTDRVHAYSPSVPVTSRLLVGSPASLLLEAAHGMDLVVVGHRHSSAGIAFGLGVGDRLAVQHTGTVIVVRVPGWPPGPGFGGRPIVVGVDRLGATTPAVRFALQEARIRGCDVTLLHAQPNAAQVGRVELIAGVRVHHRTVDADPTPALIEASNRAAAVVVGRRAFGRNPVTLLGSVSRAMVRHAYCPVFLVG